LRFVISLLALRAGRIGGTENWLRSLLAALPGQMGGDEVVVVIGRDTAQSVQTPGLERVIVDAGDGALVARRAAEAFSSWQDRALEKVFGDLRPDAVLFPQISLFPKMVSAPAVATVGDVQHLASPRSIRFADRVFRRAIYPYSLSKAASVIALSETTRDDLVSLAGLAHEKVCVIRPGCPPARDRGTIALPPVSGPYLYYPAVTHPHKGHVELLDAFSYLVIARGPLRLVLTGQKTSHWRRIRAHAKMLGIAHRVLHLGYVTDDVVDSLYAHAAAVVFPSRFEGFGLPLIEAASLGARVVASDLAVFDENGTEGVQRIDFREPEQLRAALASTTRARIAPGAWTRADEARATLAALRQAASR
jgi:glycosyltransferase involved in cell wall biosynthesis